MGTESTAATIKAQGSGNAGVTLYNLAHMRRTYRGFIASTFAADALSRRRLHFGRHGPGDQGAYNAYYGSRIDIALAAFFNWKPYW
jgi:hypothetical protein